jgi:hypothetical protein
MAVHSYIRPSGVWNSGLVVTHAEFAAFDAAQVDSLSASGGAYSLASLLTLGGAGAQVLFGGDSQLPSGTTLAVSAGAQITINGTLSVPGTAVFNIGSVGQFYGSSEYKSGSTIVIDVGATQTVNGVFTTITGSVSTFGGSAIFNGTAAFNGVTSFTSNADFAGPVAIHGSALSVSAPTTVTSDVTLSGAGTIIERVVTGTDSDSTYSVSTADLVYIPAGSISAAHTYHLDEVGAVNGKKIRFHREDNDSSKPITLKRSSDGSTICILNWDATGFTWTDVVRIAGVWQKVGGFIHP